MGNKLIRTAKQNDYLRLVSHGKNQLKMFDKSVILGSYNKYINK